MEKQYEAVLFDMDGTLIDSMWVWAQIDATYLGSFGISVPKDIEKALEGMSFTETAIYFKNRFHLPGTVEEIKKAWNELAWDFYMHHIPLKNNVRAFLELLNAKGIPMGIATSNSTELVNAILERFGIRNYFKSVRTSCEVEKGKPHPYIYLKVADDLQVDPTKCLVFEDVPNGILAAKRAGMEAWAIEDMQVEAMKEELKVLADRYIVDYEEAIAYFQE